LKFEIMVKRRELCFWWWVHWFTVLKAVTWGIMITNMMCHCKLKWIENCGYIVMKFWLNTADIVDCGLHILNLYYIASISSSYPNFISDPITICSLFCLCAFQLWTFMQCIIVQFFSKQYVIGQWRLKIIEVSCIFVVPEF
jgi:hypothetical protein